MKKILFKGSATAMVTPFDENNKINFNIFEKLIDFQINNGTQALVILGTTGESPTVTYEERTEIISKIVKKSSSFMMTISAPFSLYSIAFLIFVP